MRRGLAAVLALIAVLAANGVAAAASPSRTLEIPRADGTSIQVALFDRGAGPADRLLLVVTGSDCRKAVAQRWIDQTVAAAGPRWVAVLDKDGASADGTCGAAYEAHATEEARWYDHLAAMRRLKHELGLRPSGAFQVMALSAGGLTGCALAAASDDVGALALLSTGGGMIFADELRLLSKGDADMAANIERMSRDPRMGQTWMGGTNPQIWWWSVLGKRCLPLLRGTTIPVLIVHGDKDTSVPVESARTLRDGLAGAGPAVTYVEMPTEHDLGLKNLPADQNGVARALAWLGAR